MFIPGPDLLPRVIRCMGACYSSRAEGRFCAAYTTGSFRSLYSYSGHSSRPKGERGVVRASYRSPCAHVPTAHSLLEETWSGPSSPRGGGHPAQPRSFLGQDLAPAALTPPQDLWVPVTWKPMR